MEVTRTLAKYLIASRHQDLPREIVHEATRALLNWIGCAIGASHHETVDNAVAALRPFFGPAQAQLIGRRERVDALRAALINGISSHVLDFDDTHARAVHVSAPVWPALLAYGEWRGATGKDLIHAFALGVETEVRVGLSVFPEHYDQGYHITGTAGVFGAAAAIGKLLNLNEDQMVWALGIAATQSAGLREMFGSMCKSFLQLKREHHLRSGEIKHITLRVNPLVLELTGNKTPRDGLQGKFSVFHACAAALVHDAALEAQFADEVVRDAVVVALRDKIDASADAAIRKLEAHVRIELSDGRVLAKHVEHALGSTVRPMSDADLEHKFRGLVAGVIPDAQAKALIDLCWRFPALLDAAQLPQAAAMS